MGKTRVIRTISWDRSQDFAPVVGALQTPAAYRIILDIATPVAVPIIEIKIVRLLTRFFTHLGILDTISDDLRCRSINRWHPPNICVGLQIQVEIQCLWVVSVDLRLNRRRPATTRTLYVIVTDESYCGIVVNRFFEKPGQNSLTNLTMWLLHFIRIIAMIVQGFFILYDNPGHKLSPTDRRRCDWAIRDFYTVSLGGTEPHAGASQTVPWEVQTT